jgi:hypothetical protein
LRLCEDDEREGEILKRIRLDDASSRLCDAGEAISYW